MRIVQIGQRSIEKCIEITICSVGRRSDLRLATAFRIETRPAGIRHPDLHRA
jgi:hypothetical protein